MSIRGEYWWLRLHARGIDWAHCHTGESVPRQEGVCPDIPSLPAPAGASLVLCMPGEQARMHRVNLPHRNRRKFLDALPYALEDQLLRDPASYHLVPLSAERRATDVPVVVINHDYLSALVDQCRQAGWQPVMLVPDYLAIPAPGADAWFIDASTTPLLLRMSATQGAVLQGEPGPQTLGTLLLALEQADESPHSLRVRVASHQQYKSISRWSEMLTERQIHLDIFIDEHPRSHWLARQPIPAPGLNMLTGPYANPDSQWVNLHKLLPVTALLSALVVISGIHWFVEGKQLETQYQQLQQSIEATYQQSFPGARNLVDPRFQMEQAISAMQTRGMTNGSGMDFLGRLEQLAGHIAAQPDCQLQRVAFDGTNITLEVSVTDYESLERLQAELAQSASVDIENAELKDGRVYGRIRLGGRA